MLGFGGAPLGGFRLQVPEQTAIDSIRAAHGAGIGLFDTSPLYGYGRSEHRIGHALRELPRESFLISTKVGRRMIPLRTGEPSDRLRAGGLRFRPVFDYSHDGAMRSYDQSLARLGVGPVDILLIHDVDATTHGSEQRAWHWFEVAVNGAYRALSELRRSGDVRAIGVGLNDVRWCDRFLDATDIDCVLIAGQYTLLDQSALQEVLPKCAARNVGVILGGPFNSGILATGPVAGAMYRYDVATASIRNRVEQLEEICMAHGVPIQAAALQFPLRHPAVSIVIAGMTTPQEVEENVRFMNLPIPASFWRDLQSAGIADACVPCNPE